MFTDGTLFLTIMGNITVTWGPSSTASDAGDDDDDGGDEEGESISVTIKIMGGADFELDIIYSIEEALVSDLQSFFVSVANMK
jgi:hypothetical protein